MKKMRVLIRKAKIFLFKNNLKLNFKISIYNYLEIKLY